MLRTLQWVAAGGVVCIVAWTTRVTTSRPMALCRPGRGASWRIPDTPPFAKRLRHRITVGREMANCRAMAWLGVPFAASKTMRARRATFCGVLPEPARRVKC